MPSSSASWCSSRPAERGVSRICAHAGRPMTLHQRLPFLVRDADDHAPVVVAAALRAVGVVRGDDWSTVVVEHRRAWPVRRLPGGKPARLHAAAVDREVEQGRAGERHGGHLRQIDVLALAGAFAVIEAGEDAHGAVHAAGVVHVGPAPAGGRLAGYA